ncbi:MAG: sulfatase-like hydrolase/transferase [Halioglobus sp.]
MSIPLACYLFFHGSALWVPCSIGLSVGLYYALEASHTTLLRVISCLLSGASLFLCVMLGTSYFVQGTGFNLQYFFHFNPNSLVQAMAGFGVAFYGLLAVLVAAFLLPILLSYRDTQTAPKTALVIICWFAIVITNFPLYSYANYKMQSMEQPTGYYPQALDTSANERHYLENLAASTTAFSKKNLILIYAESLEQLYFETEVFGANLLPELSTLAEEAQRFTNMQQRYGTNWTLAGMVASQCGFPLSGMLVAGNDTMASVENPFPNERCLADILNENGYRNVFFGGADLAFSGKGNFLKTHGYDAAYGLTELLPEVGDKTYTHNWGLYDDTLFDLALAELRQLESAQEPYFLTLLTVDTHGPAGFIARSCEKEKSLSKMLQSVRCADALISKFVRQIMATVDMSKTVIVLFSDHLAMRNQVWDELRGNQDDRRLTFMLWSDGAPVVSDIETSHFDIAPTLLESVGLPGTLKLGMGQSLFYRQQMGLVDPLNKKESRLGPSLMAKDVSATQAGVRIQRDPLSINIGEKTFTVSSRGLPFESGSYLVAFDKKGYPVGALSSAQYPPTYNRMLKDRFVVGVSVDESTPGKLSYFRGFPSANGENLRAEPLKADVLLSADELKKEIAEAAPTKPSK